MSTTPSDKSTPGSPAAGMAGCNCPRMDNRNGEGMPYPDGPQFWIREDCPLHGTTPASPDAGRGEMGR